MNQLKKYNYVYRITNTKLNKHYYGVRSCDSDPKMDLGVKYFSSSTDKEFKNDQKINPQDYRYKIICVYDTRIKATESEIYLHNKFNVKNNESFYNNANQSSTWFDITGNKNTANKIRMALTGVKKSEEHNRKNSESHKGKKQSSESNRKRSETLRANPPWLGRKHTEKSKNKIRETRIKLIADGVIIPNRIIHSEETKNKIKNSNSDTYIIMSHDKIQYTIMHLKSWVKSNNVSYDSFLRAISKQKLYYPNGSEYGWAGIKFEGQSQEEITEKLLELHKQPKIKKIPSKPIANFIKSEYDKNIHTLTNKSMSFISPYGVEYIIGNIKLFCADNNISYDGLRWAIRKRKNEYNGWEYYKYHIK